MDSTAQLAALIDALPDAHLLSAGDGRVEWANAAAARLLGADAPEALRGRLLPTLIHLDEDASLSLREGAGVPVAATLARSGHPVELKSTVVPSMANVAVIALSRPTDEDALIRDLVTSRGDAIGETFLQELVMGLAQVTGAYQVFVGELQGERDERVRTLAVCRDGEVVDNFLYPLAGTPCSQVVAGGVCLHTRNVASRFPEDRGLAQLGIEGYVGEVLVDSRREPIGVLVALFTEPVPDADSSSRMLAGCATRASVELERLRVERALRDSERRYRAVVENARDGILVQRGDRILFANQAVADLLGYDSVQTIIDHPDHQHYVAPEDLERVRGFSRARAEGRSTVDRYEFDAQRADGGRIRLAVSISAIDWEGQPAFQVLLSDVTEQRAREARASQSQRMEALGKLTGGIAHDFNNLLAVILGNLELLGIHPVDDEAREIIGQVSQAAERGADLTRRLLAFARRQPLQPANIDVDALLQETRSLLGRTLGEGVELVVDGSADRPVRADPSQLQTALLNLAINARDAMPDGGRIILRPRQPGLDEIEAAVLPPAVGAWEVVAIDVEDTGTGMSEEVAAHAFEPFYTTKDGDRGTGLGLSMVHGFVRQSRGGIDLRSVPGVGTRVTLFLPAAEPESSAEAEDPAAVAEPSLSRKRVLVVEDEDPVREVAVAMLERLELDVRQAADGPSAREILSRERFDLLLSDVVLPGGERGPEIAEEALARQPDLAVLFMSGYAESDVFASGTFDRQSQLVPKPFRLEVLRRRVLEALGEN